MPSFRLSCLAYLSVAVPGSTLGLLWPLMRLSWHQPLGLLGLLLIIGVSASAAASVLTGRLMSRVRTGPIVAAGAAAIALALAAESAAPSVWVFAGGMVVFGVGFGALDTALNAHAAARFGPRRINWMHASYGLGATGGPLLATGLLAAGLGWRGTYGVQAAVQGAVAVLLALTRRAWDRRALTAPVADLAAPDSPAADLPAPDRLAPAPSRPGGPGRRADRADRARRSPPSSAGSSPVPGSGATCSSPPAVACPARWPPGPCPLTGPRCSPAAVLGPVAERFGARRVLTGGVAGLVAGAVLLTVPGPAAVPVAGLAVVGLAAAPIFPCSPWPPPSEPAAPTVPGRSACRSPRPRAATRPCPPVLAWSSGR